LKSTKSISKSDTQKKSPTLQREPDQRGPELDNSNEGLKSILSRTGPRTPPEAFASLLTRPELSHRASTSQRIGIINHLQRTYGNQYVQRVLQAKLRVGQPGDIYEQEADRVAEQVMSMPEPVVQRQPVEEEEEELIQPKPLAEQITPLVQRQVEEEEEEPLQAKEITIQPGEVSSGIESRISAIRGSGQPLPTSTRAFFEPRFGHDFSQVQVHTDAEAETLNRALDARAFTTGQDIFFQQGAYNPGSSSGREFLAHELTHVVQQAGCSHRNLTVGHAGESREQETDKAAREVMRREQQTATPQIQRRVQILDDPLPPGGMGPPARTGAAFIERNLEAYTGLNLSFDGDFLAVDAATRRAVRRERRERPTPAHVRARLFIIPGVPRERASQALKLAQIIIDTRATARIQPVFGEAGVVMGQFPAGGGGGVQEVDIEDLRNWQSMTEPSQEPLLRILAFLRRLLGRAAAPRPATPLRTDSAGSHLYHEIVESFRAALTGPGTAFPGPHRRAIETVNIAQRAMRRLEFLNCPLPPPSPSPGGETRFDTFWRRRRGRGREDRFRQALFFENTSGNFNLIWVDPPVRIAVNVPSTDPCPP
jgi:hypothetical protein